MTAMACDVIQRAVTTGIITHILLSGLQIRRLSDPHNTHKRSRHYTHDLDRTQHAHGGVWKHEAPLGHAITPTPVPPLNSLTPHSRTGSKNGVLHTVSAV